ncbi:hypothetical protein [Undibacterium fentianense]|uniref:Peptidase M15 n=1 Tax=Undibacterium fentianense TaxID=2828728 RepID=A0A941E0V8_9BURK|nr:hypothetical protein [Undibacterium fentianense]MBR7801159.1 hypothetical protein [Undibacterium fentianense]
MRKTISYKSFDDLGRVKLSRSFYMREFLYSEISNFYGVQNIPENPDLAVANGRNLCESLLEPLNSTFGRISIRSAYRSLAVNGLGNEKGHNCGSNEKNYANHIWDIPDSEGLHGAMACIIVPWFTERYEAGADWRAMAYWIHNNLPYSELQFFPKLCAFNIGWHEKPKRKIESYIKGSSGILTQGEPVNPKYADCYATFPEMKL